MDQGLPLSCEIMKMTQYQTRTVLTCGTSETVGAFAITTPITVAGVTRVKVRAVLN